MQRLIPLIAMIITAFLIGGCHQKDPDKVKLTCKDDPAGRTKAEQQEIGSDCFRSGSYTKSAPKNW